VIYARDPQGCFLRQLPNFNIFASPFQNDQLEPPMAFVNHKADNVVSGIIAVRLKLNDLSRPNRLKVYILPHPIYHFYFGISPSFILIFISMPYIKRRQLTGNIFMKVVAVKILSNSKGNGEEFFNEVETMGKKSLFECGSPSWNRFLGWERLHHSALGIAKGIEFLHEGCDQRILHFDIKPQKILLDNDFTPKISDFGLAKLCSKDNSAVSMTITRGTIGYIEPEMFSRNFGDMSYKSDIYSFRMVVLEMVGGRKNVDNLAGNSEQIYFPKWVYNFLDEGEDLRVYIDQKEDAKIAKKLAIVGLRCIQGNLVDRPSTKLVVQMLEGQGENLTKPPNPFGSS
ncbi:hypothetical protein Tsubulata_000441, partial [Turnera subulata]